MGSAPTSPLDRATASLLDHLLAEQRSLTAVDRFARRHDAARPSPPVYQDLIPLSGPGPGQQLAFRVDLDACTGCKACVTACHSLNGLDPDETWRSVGRLLGASEQGAVQQTVTTSCHHCEEPACLSGCPVRAYEKDPVTGIVRHLDDQCIGCRYCTLTCPYDAPRFNDRLGIVRKCDMCAGRLSAGEPPACVQGCPNGAISIRIVDRSENGVPEALLPSGADAAASARHTRPTTRYVTSASGTGLAAADRDRLAPREAHDPLAVMLVAVQLGLGLLVCDAALEMAGVGSAGRAARLLFAAAATGLGLAASTFHLGRPLYAFRAFLGWRTSWMSREVIALGAYFALLSGAALLAAAEAWLPGLRPPDGLRALLATAALATGLAAAHCSIMIYASTHRRFWAYRRTAPRFAASAAASGALAAAACLGFERGAGAAPTSLLGIAVVAALAKLGVELAFLRRRREDSDLGRSARLLAGALRRRFATRAGLTLAGVACAALGLAVGGGAALGFALVALPLLVAGELFERHLFFTAEAARAMPGA